ncbi:MAG: TRAM domain-containing protein [Synergistetes bacterium]|nr:TRAM domain-containing protein [Synergistota bacterium]MCX8127373.1 TRAM domain-containing protein [Synergistota bacterium]MDW8192237.1 TRAM domain-containing protein [Synergistota bacterium]
MAGKQIYFVERILQFVFVFLGLGIGYQVSPYVLRYIDYSLTAVEKMSLVGAVTVIGGFIMYILSPSIIRVILKVVSRVESDLQKLPAIDIAIGLLGLILGLIVANLLAVSLTPIPIIGEYFPLILNIIFGYLGVGLALRKKEEIMTILGLIPRLKDKLSLRPSKKEAYVTELPCPKILDTSVIIDGRILDIYKTGFLEGSILIPRFVLNELQYVADSTDPMKRSRGRRGLDILTKIQKEGKDRVRIYEDEVDGKSVDEKLITLAKKLNAEIITTDYNLNKVANIEGVRVLNINELANALKPLVLPGEELEVQIIREGKESGQGVGYLDDGTMVVVEEGRSYIGKVVELQVTSVLQTAAGRMIFGKIKRITK